LKEDNFIKESLKRFRKLLLREWVDRNDVVDAIENADIVYIYYAGDDTVNRGFRTIEPYALGTSKAGNLVLRAWQQAGASDSKKNASRSNDEIPGWRLFRLDGITSFMKTFKKFDINSPRPNYNPDDKGMTSIITAVDTSKTATTQVKGTDSVETPDQAKDKLNFFDTQVKSFKDFYDSSKK
jgi:hypothetical protein